MRPASPKTTVLLADDRGLAREGLRRLLAEQTELDVIAEASTGESALETLRTRRPDLCVVAAELADMAGHQIIRQARLEQIETRFVMVFLPNCAMHVREALEAGAMGLVAGSAELLDLIGAIEAVRSGHVYLSSSLIDLLGAAVTPASERVGSRLAALTIREREVLRLIGQGLSTREVAARLAISPRTVETHRAHLMSKLSARRASMLVRIALEEGLVES